MPLKSLKNENINKIKNKKNEKIVEIIQSEDSDSEVEYQEMDSNSLIKHDDNYIYNEVFDAKTIISTLVENIFHDESYQEYLKDLEESDDKNSSKKLKNIRDTFATIKVFNNNRDPLFVSKDIGTIIGASNVKVMIKDYTATEKVVGLLDKNGKAYRTEFLTRHGIYRLLLTNRTKLSDVFRGFIYKLLDHMYYHEIDKLNSLIKEYTDENKELVGEAAKELDENIANYKLLFEIERQERKDLEKETAAGYLEMKKLRAEKQSVIEKFKDFQAEYEAEESYLLLQALKKKYMKEFTIWLVNPSILDKMFKGVKAPYKYDTEKYFLDDYINSFDFLIRELAHGSEINRTQIFYLVLTYTPNKDDVKTLKDKAATGNSVVQLENLTIEEEKYTEDYPVYVDSVIDKNSLSTLVERLKEETEYFQISKSKKSANNFVFKTSIEHIEEVANNLIMESVNIERRSNRDRLG